MADAGILKSVKNALSITGDYLDNTLSVYIDDVVDYLITAGVSDAVVKAPAAAGVIARGVSDLWNYGSAGGKLSEYFYQRAIQLKYKSEGGVKNE